MSKIAPRTMRNDNDLGARRHPRASEARSPRCIGRGVSWVTSPGRKLPRDPRRRQSRRRRVGNSETVVPPEQAMSKT